MQIRADNISKRQNSHELLALIFKLITTIKKNANESWCLIEEVPEKYLTNGLLVLEEMNFTIFGFHLHDINFRNCRFNYCGFSSQLFTNCDFSEAVFSDARFYECQMDKRTGSQLSKKVVDEFVDYNDEKDSEYNIKIIDDQIPHGVMRAIAKKWISKIRNFKNVNDDLHIELVSPRMKNKEICQYVIEQCKPVNSYYDSIVIDVINGFYNFRPGDDEFADKHYRGWKLHLSVNKHQVKQAYNSIASVLLNNDDIFHFKVTDVTVKEQDRGSRLYNGGQFTIYLYQNGIKPLVSEERLKIVLQEITEKLQQDNIMPGDIPESDRLTIFPYCSLRNDGDGFFIYYPAYYSGTNYNPYNLPCTFDNLLIARVKPFNVEDHFASFYKSSKSHYIRAIATTLIALITEIIKPEHVFNIEYIDELAEEQGLYDRNTYLQLARFYTVETSFVKENTSKCDLIVLFLLLENINVLMRAVEEPEKDGDYIINLIEKLNAFTLSFRDLINHKYTVSSALMPCAIRTHLLNDEPYKLLDNIKRLYTLIPLWIKNSNTVEVVEADLTELRNNLAIKLGDKAEQLSTLDEDRLAILIQYHVEAKRLIHAGITYNMINKTPIEVLLGVLSKYDEVHIICSLSNMTMPEFISLRYKEIMLALSHPANVKKILQYFGIILKEFVSISTHQCNVLLDHIHEMKSNSCVYEFKTLMAFDNTYLKMLLVTVIRHDIKLCVSTLQAIYKQNDLVRNYCLEYAGSLEGILNKFSLTIENFYSLSQCFFSVEVDMPIKLDIITNKLHITIDQIINMPVPLKTSLCDNIYTISDLFMHYSIVFNDLLDIDDNQKCDIFDNSYFLLQFAKLGVSYIDIIHALHTILLEDKLNFSNLEKYRNEIIILIKHGVAFEKIFTLSVNDINKLQIARNDNELFSIWKSAHTQKNTGKNVIAFANEYFPIDENETNFKIRN